MIRTRLMLILLIAFTGIGFSAHAQDVTTVSAVVETVPSPGDGATAPTIWLHPFDLTKSLIIAADDNQGIGAYDLNGELLEFLNIGSALATDVRYNFPFGRARVSLVAAAIEDSSTVFFYSIDEESLRFEPLGQIETGIAQSGMCLYTSPATGRFYVFVTGENGDVEQYLLDASDGMISGRLLRRFNVGSETEGCTADDEYRALYVSEGEVAFWRYGAEPESGTNRRIVDLLAPRGNISEEIEGAAIIRGANGSGYVMVTNEKNHSFLLYERRGANAFIGEFGIRASESIDAVTEPTGFAAAALALDARFPRGLFVTSDDRNSNPTARNNFKLVSWGDVEDTLGLTPLSGFDPRVIAQVASDSPAVTALLETAPVPGSIDAADDPAIWIHPTDPALSTIIGTDKTRGLVVYALDGTILQTADIGRVNNVDLRYNFMLNGTARAIVVTTNRSTNSLDIFIVDDSTRQIEDAAARLIVSAVEEVYGVCLYVSPVDGTHYAFVNSADTGEVEQYRLFATPEGRIDAEVVRTFVVGSQTEGCVVDDENRILYIGEEGRGVWRYGAEATDDETRTLIDSTAQDGNLTADVEGIALYRTADGGGYLIVSSQGSSEFAVYARQGDNAYIGAFVILEGDGVDGVSGTDGIEVTSFPLGDRFPQGLFIAQDDLNIDPDDNQNFKLVSWAQIAEALGLVIDTTYDPRQVGAR